MSRAFAIVVVFAVSVSAALAQDVDSLLDAMTARGTEPVVATFKSSRILNGHSIEQMRAGDLDVRIHHRFGPVNSGPGEFWGLDVSTVYLGLELGVTDWLMLGVGRSSYQKTVSGFAKMKLLRQEIGEGAMPVALSLFAGMDVTGHPWPYAARTERLVERMSSVLQILIARKLSEALSLQVTPTLVHRNLVEGPGGNNELYAVGIGGRYKLSPRISVNAEYHALVQTFDPSNDARTSTLSLGCDIETGGHVFQLILTNALPMFERGFIGETGTTWGDGGIHIGFNISRVFSL